MTPRSHPSEQLKPPDKSESMQVHHGALGGISPVRPSDDVGNGWKTPCPDAHKDGFLGLGLHLLSYTHVRAGKC